MPRQRARPFRGLGGSFTGRDSGLSLWSGEGQRALVLQKCRLGRAASVDRNGPLDEQPAHAE